MKLKALDSHIHLDILVKNLPDAVSKFKEWSCGGISWCYVENITSFKEYKKVWENLKSLCRESFNQTPMYYMIGIHPRSIPEDLVGDDLPLELKQWLKEHLSQPECLGIGEIGLDSEQDLETELRVFEAQLNWCVENLPDDKRIGIHTPKINKEKTTEKLLKILQNYPSLKDKIVIDHTTPTTWGWVKEEGYVCGVTLQPGKCSIKDLEHILERNPDAFENTILNSDSASEISKPFIDFIKNSLFEENITKKLILENAVDFFKLVI